MEKLKSSLLNMFLSLALICIVVGGVLAGVNELTQEPIEASKKAKLENAIKEVVPEFTNFPVEDAYFAHISEKDSLKIYPAKKQGEVIALAVESNTMKGFSGEVKIIVGIDKENKVINYAVLQHAETPGLGDKMGVWFKTDKNKQSIIGKDLSKGELKVSKDGGEVDAITAATISSRAFLDAVNRAYLATSKKTDVESGATTQEQEETTEDATSGATTKN